MNRIPLTDADFKFISKLIYQRAGIVLSDNKREMVYNRLARRVQALDFDDFAEYLRFIEVNPNHDEWQNFTNSLTTNLTSFFRESHHFKVLKEHAEQSRGAYKVWSAAASTGEEPYSIAFSLTEVYQNKYDAFQIFASDIDTNVLETAQNAIYKLEQLRDVSPEILQNFFLRGTGARAGMVKVKPEIANKVKFSQVNLLDNDWAVQGPFDAIFCRNVMIYFDKDTQERILKKFVPLLKPNGIIFAGHSENFTQISKDLYSKGQTVYGLLRDKK
ncbi:protein-glutamate O-methyltransferase CheR [Thorsellia kenyensis]|uniref:Chemotaxis protein methyltransferase n=1 Tax=Thorsellia kenyensis TaxID=1549888 RepID=A0ABV6C8X8_9GAMM